MDTKKLRQKILDLAIRGKLVPQDPNDEPASLLLERIRAEKERLVKEGKIKKSKSAKTSDTPHYENLPFEVPSSWVWCKLGDVISIKSGDSIRVRDNRQGEYPIYGGNGINGYYNDYNAKPDTIVIGRVGFYCGSVHQTVSKAWVTDNAFIVSYESIFNSKYLHHLLEWLQLSKTSNSTAQPVISGKGIYPLSIPIPPFAEQQRIVAEIERWFALIDKMEQGKADLQVVIKQAKSKILDLAIHGKLVPQDPNDEPATELLKRINPKAEITCDNGQYGKIPKNWCASKLVDICSFLSRGKSPKYSEDDKTYPVFAQKCNLKDGGISLEQARFLDPSTINKWNDVYKLQTGDVLVNSTGTGTVGRTRLFNTNCLGSYPFVVPDSHVSVIRVLKSICPQFIYAFISSNSIQQYMKENLAGSTNQKELYIGVLENMQIFLPPLAEQHRIVAKIEELFSSLDNIQKALEV